MPRRPLSKDPKATSRTLLGARRSSISPSVPVRAVVFALRASRSSPSAQVLQALLLANIVSKVVRSMLRRSAMAIGDGVMEKGGKQWMGVETSADGLSYASSARQKPHSSVVRSPSYRPDVVLQRKSGGEKFDQRVFENRRTGKHTLKMVPSLIKDFIGTPLGIKRWSNSVGAIFDGQNSVISRHPKPFWPPEALNPARNMDTGSINILRKEVPGWGDVPCVMGHQVHRPLDARTQLPELSTPHRLA